MSDKLNDFSFNLDEEANNKRQAYRARIPGLLLLVQERKTGYAVKDLSALGVAFECATPGLFSEGQEVVCRLELGGKPILTDATIKVVHVLPNGLFGCTFEGLDTRQEAALDKLILEVQKQRINQRKRQEK